MEGIKRMNKGQYTKARQYFARALKNDPKECHVHFLNALSWQMEGKANNYRLLDIASVGYQSTIKFCPNEPWAYYYLGLINYQKKQYNLAEINFAMAMKLSKGKYNMPYFNAFILSAQKNNDRESIKVMKAQLEKIDKNSSLLKELEQILEKMPVLELIPPHSSKTNASMKNTGYTTGKKIRTPARISKSKPKDLSHKKPSIKINPYKQRKQAFLDAVFILTREQDEEKRGVNLLTGLQLQYGINEANNRFGTGNWQQYADALKANPVLGNTGGNPALAYSTLITQTLSIPTLTYNLNIFNDQAENDEVISRPTLLARDGAPAEYFSGSEIMLGVSGLNSGQVQIIPLGLSMKVTSHFLKNGSINLDIRMSRENLTIGAVPVGTFQSSATAVKDTTHTTVNIHFGETIILSALSETASLFLVNKTPGLGDLPLVRNAFNQRGVFRQNTSLLILLTPHPFSSYASAKDKNSPVYYQKELSRYVDNFLEKSSSLSVLLRHIRALPLYSVGKILTTDFYNKNYIAGAIGYNYRSIDEF